MRKKILALSLAMLMVFSLSITAFAAEGDGSWETGITVNSVKEGATYTVYKVFDLSVDEGRSAYTYTLRDEWADFIKTNSAATAIFSTRPLTNGDTLVEAKSDVKAAEMNAFVKAAEAFARESKFTPAASWTNGVGETAATSHTFELPDAGYYLVTSSIGTNAMVLTTPNAPQATVNEKNPVPTLDKQVNMNDTDATEEGLLADWGTVNDVKVGDTVEYKITVTVPSTVTGIQSDGHVHHHHTDACPVEGEGDDARYACGYNYDCGVQGEDGKWSDCSIDDDGYTSTGAANYVIHDSLDKDLTFVPGSVRIELTRGTGENVIAPENYEILLAEAGDDYAAHGHKTSEGGLPCTFEIRFKQAYLDTLRGDDIITVYYNATVNDDAAVIVEHDNTAYLDYGHVYNDDGTPKEYDPNDKRPETPHKTTKTYTWKMDVLKYTVGENGSEDALAGAEFVLSRDAGEGGENTPDIAHIDLVKVSDNVYRVALSDDAAADITTIVTDETGRFTIQGLDSGTYYLHEVNPPTGFNAIEKSIPVTIIGVNGEGAHDAYANEVDADAANAGSVEQEAAGPANESDQSNTKLGYRPVDEVKVLNNSGLKMPETGGIGTTIFYVVGGVLVVGAVVLLVAKKRTGDDE